MRFTRTISSSSAWFNPEFIERHPSPLLYYRLPDKIVRTIFAFSEA